MNKFLTITFGIIFLIATPLLSDAQKSIKLTKVKSGKEFILPEGTRVAYLLDSGFVSGVAIKKIIPNVIVRNLFISIWPF